VTEDPKIKTLAVRKSMLLERRSGCVPDVKVFSHVKALRRSRGNPSDPFSQTERASRKLRHHPSAISAETRSRDGLV